MFSVTKEAAQFRLQDPLYCKAQRLAGIVYNEMVKLNCQRYTWTENALLLWYCPHLPANAFLPQTLQVQQCHFLPSVFTKKKKTPHTSLPQQSYWILPPTIAYIIKTTSAIAAQYGSRTERGRSSTRLNRKKNKNKSRILYQKSFLQSIKGHISN